MFSRNSVEVHSIAVFGDSIGHSGQQFNPSSILKVLDLFNGFLITATYRGIIVVVSQNVHQYLGYTEVTNKEKL